MLPAGAQTPQLGDIDGDRVATVRDIALIAEHMKGTAPLDAVKAELADLNRDGTVNEADMSEMVKEILQTRTPEALPLATVESSSPYTGESDVAVTRETIVHFTIPLAVNTLLDTTTFYAEFGPRKILSRAEISSDRTKATLFYLEPIPSSAQVKVTLKGDGLTDLLGRPFDADGDGVAGGTSTTTFNTLSITPVAATAIRGRVFASERAIGGTDLPLAGVTVTVDGAEETLRTVTDGQGNFTLSPCPAGSFFVHIDGRTSPQSSWPAGAYYPAVGKQWDAVAGRADNLAGSASDTVRGTIYLPLVSPGTLQTASQTQETPVAFPPTVLAANPALAGTRLDIPANSLFADDGTRGGKVGIAPVAPDRIPSPLPPGLNLPMVITVQTDGGTNFDRPVPVTFPNLPDPITGLKKLPGETSALWSFNHDTGQWEVVGPMTVSDDGNYVTTDAGVGISQPGWHGEQPGSPTKAPPPPKKKCPPANINAWEFALDAAATAADCAKEFVKVGKLVERLMKGVSKAREVKDFLKGTYADVQAGRINCQIYRASIVVLNQGLEEMEESLLEMNRLGSPLAKIMAALACVEGVMDLLEPFCEGLDDNPECFGSIASGACNLRQFVGENAGNLKKYYELVNSSLADLAIAPLRVIVQQLSNRLDERCGAQNNIVKNPQKKDIRSDDPQPLDISDEAIIEDLTSILDRLETLEDIPNEDKSNELNLLIKSESVVTGYLGDAFAAVEGHPTTYIARIDYGNSFQRQSANKSGLIQFILPPDTIFALKIVDLTTLHIGTQVGVTSPNGIPTQLYGTALSASNGSDADSDGLSEEIEDAIGTNPQKPDTDNDNISDGAEVKQGTNPLDGLAVSTGVLASAPTTAPAIDITAANNLAVTANGERGITVFNALSGLNPSRIAEVDTPGQAVAVATSGDFVAVADYTAGLAVVDLTNPAAIGIRHQVGLGAPVVAVVTSGPLAFVGTADGKVHLVDLPSGARLGQLALGGSSSVQGLAVSGDVVYALQAGTLSAIQWKPTLSVTGTVNASGQTGAGQRRLRLFAGSGTLYSTWMSGFNLFDTTANPRQPVFIRQFGTQQFGWKQLVANGSGLGIVAASPNSTDDGPHDLDLYNLGADGRQSDFLTTLTTPGLAAAVSIYNGLAYVADSASGLQVVNYLAYDNKKIAPTIALTSNFNLTGGNAEEGSLMRLTAAVADDVQVRNVEFYADDALLATDGNYPFEIRFVTPAISPTKTSFKVKARATDTGGNATWSTEYTLNLVPDATPPAVAAFLPENGQVEQFARTVSVRFNEPVAENSLATGLALTSAGPDKIHGNADDTAVTGSSLNYSAETAVATLIFAADLPPGRYEIHVAPPLSDAAGNVLAQAQFARFIVPGPGDGDADDLPDDFEPLLGLDPTKRDTNNNGKPDGLEDFDDDGLTNVQEILLGFRPNVADSDGNGIKDGNEDRDFDGLSDLAELAAGTNWFIADTDGDGVLDEAEVAGGSNPVDSSSTPYNRPGAVYARQAGVQMHRYVFDSAAGGFLQAAQPVLQLSRLQVTGAAPAQGLIMSHQSPVQMNRFSPDLGGILGTPPVQVNSKPIP